MGKLQNEDFKTEAEITGAGGTKSQLPNDDKIYVTADSINKTLKEAIQDGDIGSGGIGSPSIYGLLNGEKPNDTVTGWTGASINSSTPLSGDNSYDITFPGNTPLITIPERSKDRKNRCLLQVRITSGTCKFIVKDQAATNIGEISVNASGQVELPDFLLTTETGVQLFWEDVSSATGVTIDDIYFDDNPPSGQGSVTTTEKILPSNVTATGDIASMQFTGLDTNKKYLLTGQIKAGSANGADTEVSYYSGAGATGTLYGRSTVRGQDAGANDLNNQGVSMIVDPVSSDIYVRVTAISSPGVLEGDTTKGETFLQLTEYISPLGTEDKLNLTDGIAAPTTETFAQIYIDTADGDLKIKFSDGTVKTIVTDS